MHLIVRRRKAMTRPIWSTDEEPDGPDRPDGGPDRPDGPDQAQAPYFYEIAYSVKNNSQLLNRLTVISHGRVGSTP